MATVMTPRLKKIQEFDFVFWKSRKNVSYVGHKGLSENVEVPKNAEFIWVELSDNPIKDGVKVLIRGCYCEEIHICGKDGWRVFTRNSNFIFNIRKAKILSPGEVKFVYLRLWYQE